MCRESKNCIYFQHHIQSKRSAFYVRNYGRIENSKFAGQKKKKKNSTHFQGGKAENLDCWHVFSSRLQRSHANPLSRFVSVKFQQLSLFG